MTAVEEQFNGIHGFFRLLQRAAAAFFAIALRRFALSFSARALPPAGAAFSAIRDSSSGGSFARALPPRRPRATAAGFFLRTIVGN
ncbi:MAG: hypothetical protein JO097_00175 [Acidobacteriaceae bacterium]|nr:hypothetical protein [Acidobacteriaceae bacterium]